MPVNRQWVLQRRPLGAIAREDLALIEVPAPELKPGQVLLRNLYLSIDPTQRIWMSDRDQYMPPVELGQTMRGGTLAVVEASRCETLPEGAIVNGGLAGWEAYTVAEGRGLRALRRAPGVPLTAYMSVLGATGLTAWFGVHDVCQVKAGETLVVTGAAGAVGSVAGQLAKLRGARVVGIAGGGAKTAWLRDELGFDGAIDYRSEDVGAALDRLCPDGIDAGFENVGGEIMDQVFDRLNNFGRLAVCGLISSYNETGPARGPANFSAVLMRRLTIRGFLISDYFSRASEALAELGPLVAAGKIKWKVHVVDGLENAPEALNRLFTGDHDGKLLVRISPEPD